MQCNAVLLVSCSDDIAVHSRANADLTSLIGVAILLYLLTAVEDEITLYESCACLLEICIYLIYLLIYVLFTFRQTFCSDFV